MRTKILLTIAATATILAGCSNEETNEAIDSWDGEIRLSSGLAVQTRANTPSDQGQQIASGQEVGVFINAVADNAVVSANLKYDANGSGTLTLNASQSQTAPHYPNGNAVKIVAYQPYDTNAGTAFAGGSGSDTYDFSVKADQSGNSNGDYYDSDLLYATKDNAAAQTAAHKLTFTHKLSKILCTLTAGDGIDQNDLRSATVSIVGAKIKGTFKPTDGTFAVTSETTGAGNVSDVKLNSAITQSSYIGIIPPQTFAKDAKFIEVAIGSSKFYYKVTEGSGITLAAAKVHNYAITVKASGLSVESEITDWTGKDEQASTGDATMDEPASGGGAGS